MTVVLSGDVIGIHDPSRIEDAEPLLAWLQEDRSRSVDLSRAGCLHAAVVQILIAFRPRLVTTLNDPFMERWVYPLVRPEC